MMTIGEVAALAGVSTHTLRHYDTLGMLAPRVRSDAGYRLYGNEELLRLREILIWRYLGFPLADVQVLLDEPERTDVLRRQLDIAASQLDRFDAITRGLERALAEIDEGRSPTAEEIFADLSGTLLESDASALPAGRPAPVGSRPQGAHDRAMESVDRRPRAWARARADNRDGDGAAPGRIVAIDPIRLAESLLALGVVPVGTGTYEDRFTAFEDCFVGPAVAEQAKGAWTWPPYVEPAVRERIADIGYYGSDFERIKALKPDVILDLTAPGTISPTTTLAEVMGDESDRASLLEVAPTLLVPYFPNVEPPPLPTFRFVLARVAAILDEQALAEQLLAVWDARVRALRVHLKGRRVAVVATWGPERRTWGGSFFSPGAGHFWRSCCSRG